MIDINTTIGEVCLIAPTKSEVNNLQLKDSDLVSFLPMEDLGIGVKRIIPTKNRTIAEVSGSYTYFAEGDILLAKVTPCFENGKLGIATDLTNGVGYGSSEFIVIRPNPKIVLPSYVYYRLQESRFKKEGRSLMVGACGLKRLPKKFVSDTIIPQVSLSEQQRIVDILDKEFANIDSLKANAEKNLQNAKDLFQAALKKELEQKEGWKKSTVSNVCSIVGRIGFRGYTKSDLVATPKDGAIALSPSNIKDREMSYEKCSYISWHKYEESPEIKIYNGDILLVKTGSSYGKCAIVNDLPHQATINPQFVVLKDIKIERRFLWYSLNAPFAKSCYNEFVSGAAIPTFSQKNLGMMRIFLPSNKEQQQIVSRLDNLNDKCKILQENYTKSIALCDNLKQALLRKAFNGEL